MGIAIGYAYSSFIASTIGWPWSFLLEAIVAFPFAIFFYFASSSESATSPTTSPSKSLTPRVAQSRSDDDGEYLVTSEYGIEIPPQDRNNPPASHEIFEGRRRPHPTVKEELFSALTNPLYVTLVLGNAAQTATLVGVSTFGSAFMMGLGFFQSESESSTFFGILISIAGIVGTPLGGAILDGIAPPGGSEEEVADNSSAMNTRHWKSMISICELIYWCSFVGTIVLCLLYFVREKVAYLTLVTLGCTIIFMTISGINMATMLSVPLDRRSFAVGLSTVCVHLFGDVPSPIIAGYMKDTLSPACTASSGSEGVYSSAACRSQEGGLRMTMFALYAWGYLAVVFFWLTWRICLTRSISIG